MKHAKPNPNKKRIAAAALAVGTTGSIPLVFAGPASADNSIDCKDIGHQVDTSAGDPNGLDADGDGVGCESFPGPATPLDGAATLAPRALVATTPATKDDTACEDYIVNRGDNLSTIAARYGVPLADLEALNPGIIAGDRPDDYSLIFRGGHVHLPDGSCTPVKPVPVPPRHKHERPVHVWYRDCTDAPAGLHRGQAGYRHSLDMDGDGKACEGAWPPAPPVVTPPVDNPPPDDGGTTTPPVDGGAAADSPNVPSSVTRWHDTIVQAMNLVGWNPAEQVTFIGYNSKYSNGGGYPCNLYSWACSPHTLSRVGAIEELMLFESSGDPNAVNGSDSNAQNGTPSKGLMQVIQPTFDAYHVAGTSTDLLDPLANIAAALAYIDDVYGGNIPGTPY